MKRLIPAVVIVLIVLCLNHFSDYYIQNVCSGALNLTEQCEEEWNAEKEYEGTLTKLQEYWNRQEYVLSFFVNHEKLSDVELEIKSLFHEKIQSEKAVFHEHIETLKVRLEQIADDTKLNIKSLA